MRKQLAPWKILSTKTVHATPWIEIIEDNCIANSTELTYTYTKRVDEGPVIIAESTAGKLWLVRQYRHPIKKIIWQFPVEGMLPNESWEEAARRGLSEELQLEAKTFVNLGEFYPDPGGLEQKYQAFIATGLAVLPKQLHSHTDHEVEELEKQCFSLEEIDDLISSGELCDNWTLAGLFLYQRYKKAAL